MATLGKQFMNKNKVRILSYIAGIIDGEGHIGIAKSSHPNTTRERTADYNLRVAVKMCDGKVIDYLFGNYNGHVGIRPAVPPRNKQYYWVLTCKKASELLKQLLPYLVGKKEQAELAIRFQSKRKSGKKRDVIFDEWAYLSMKNLHKTYHECAAASTKHNELPMAISDSQILQESKL